MPRNAVAQTGYLAGVCLAANAMPGLAFRVPRSCEDIQAAVNTVLEHDWCATLARDRTRVLPADAEPTLSMVADVCMAGDKDEWWHGYADALLAVAMSLDLPAISPRPGALAVVGLLLDRLEPDRLADRDEIAHLLTQGAKTEVVSIWPCGEGPQSLGRIALASVVVSLPHGRQAAKAIAKRTGALLIETSLPVGLGGTVRFVREVARTVGQDAEGFLDRQLRQYAPRLEWVVPHALLHRVVRVETDPHLGESIRSFLREVGCRTDDEGRPDLVIGPRPAVEAAATMGVAYLEAGFPSPGSHGLYPTPAWLGFEGAMRLVEAIANRLVQWEVLERLRRPVRQ